MKTYATVSSSCIQLILVDNETVPSLFYVVLCNCKTGYGYIQHMHLKTQLYLMLRVTVTGIGRGHGQSERYVKKYVQICDVVQAESNT